MSSKILIRGGCVLTLGARTPNYTQADVLIEDGRVVEVGSGLRARGAELIDADDCIVMPGFVDTHRHAWRSLFKNLGESGGAGGAPLSPTVYGPHFQPDDVYASTLIGLLGAVEAGITTVADWADIPTGTDYAEAALQAHADSGLRTVYVCSAPEWSGGPADHAAALRAVLAGHGDGVGSTTMAAGVAEPLRLDLDRVAGDWAQARELGLRIHAHAGSDPSQRGVVADLAQRGLLGSDVTLIHCTHLDEADFDAIASSGASVCLAPSSEMARGSGSPLVQRLLDRDIRPGLGIDDERIAPGDMFGPMRETIALQHATYFDRKLAGKGGLPNLLTTREVIRYATSEGARVTGLGEVTGSLEPGKQADIVVFRTDRPNIFPINDPIGAVVWGMDTSNIDWVLVGGRALVRDGTLTADVDRARDLARAAQRRVGLASGLLVEAGSGGTG